MTEAVKTGHSVPSDNKLLRGLSAEQALTIYQSGKTIKIEPGKVIMSEGVNSEHLFLVLSGELEVYLPHNEKRFSQISLCRLTPGGYVGEYSLLDNLPASADVKATRESELFQIPHSRIKALFNSDPDIGRVIYRNLLTTLVTRLRESDRELDLAQQFT